MDSGGVGDFVRQIPQGFILTFCGSGILLVIALAYIFRDRFLARKAVPPAVAAAASGSMAVNGASSADLPDLDMLSSSSSFSSPRAGGTYSLALADGETVEAVEVFTVLRDVAEGGLIVQIGDKAYRNPPAFADTEFKRRFHSTLRDLSVAAQTPPAPRAQPVVQPASPAEDANDDMPPLDTTASSEVPRVSPYVSAPGDLPKFRMPDNPVKPKRGQRPVAEPIPEINIAGSIETFLQHKLSMTSQFANRSIHVRPAPQGGVTIEVDGRFYESVGEVDDPAVRQFLSSTIEEWQARQ